MPIVRLHDSSAIAARRIAVRAQREALPPQPPRGAPAQWGLNRCGWVRNGIRGRAGVSLGCEAQWERYLDALANSKAWDDALKALVKDKIRQQLPADDLADALADILPADEAYIIPDLLPAVSAGGGSATVAWPEPPIDPTWTEAAARYEPADTGGVAHAGDSRYVPNNTGLSIYSSGSIPGPAYLVGLVIMTSNTFQEYFTAAAAVDTLGLVYRHSGIGNWSYNMPVNISLPDFFIDHPVGFHCSFSGSINNSGGDDLNSIDAMVYYKHARRVS